MTFSLQNVVLRCMGLNKPLFHVNCTPFIKQKANPEKNLLSVQGGGSSTRPMKDRHPGEPVFLFF